MCAMRRCIAQLWAGSGQNVGQAELRSILRCLSAAEDLESLLQHIAAALDTPAPDGAASQRSVATKMSADVALRCLGEPDRCRTARHQSDIVQQCCRRGKWVSCIQTVLLSAHFYQAALLPCQSVHS